MLTRQPPDVSRNINRFLFIHEITRTMTFLNPRCARMNDDITR